MEKMANVVVSNARDCDGLATALAAFSKENDDALRTWNAYRKKATAEQKDAFYRRYKDRADAWAKKSDPVIEACVHNQALMRVLKQMEE
jgi:hypothetical protein